MYFCCMPLYTALMQLTYSEKFRASWMFFVTPVENPGLIISGSVKCLIFIFLVPLMSMIVVLGLAIQGFSILPNLLFGCVNLLAIDTFFAYIIVRKLPFSTAYESAKQGTTFIKTMLFMIAPVAFGMVHWFLSGFQWVILLLIVISSVAVWLVFDEIKKRDWASLT